MLALIILLAGTASAAPAAAGMFTVFIGSPVGTPSIGSASDSGSSPVSRELVGAPLGVGTLLDGGAAASFGHVGGDSHAAIGSSGYFGSAFGIGTHSTSSDFVTFSADDPAVTHVLIAANLAFSGSLNTTAFASATVDLSFSVSGIVSNLLFSANDDTGVTRNDFQVAQGSVSGTLNSALLRTHTFFVPVDQPLLITLSLSTAAGVGGSGSPESAKSSFSNSFEFPIGSDAFVLPAGVSANAGDWLVDNRRVAAVAAVPEPATWATMLMGLGAFGGLTRLRRGAERRRSSRLKSL
jgi:hypothetical protein